MTRAKLSPRRLFQTVLIALFAALVSIGAFAQQHSGNKSANSQQPPPDANYWHRVRPPDLDLPQIPGRRDFGGCDAVDATLGRPECGGGQPSPPPPPPPPNHCRAKPARRELLGMAMPVK